MATVILSDETVKNLIEAHASMAAWYYAMSKALRDAGAGVHPPSDADRKAFVQSMAQHYPEIAAIAQSIDAPRAFVPPPVVAAPAQVVENEGIVTPEPPKDHVAAPAALPGHELKVQRPPPQEPQTQTQQDQAQQDQPQESQPPTDVPPPPAIVDPNKVKYE